MKEKMAGNYYGAAFIFPLLFCFSISLAAPSINDFPQRSSPFIPPFLIAKESEREKGKYFNREKQETDDDHK